MCVDVRAYKTIATQCLSIGVVIHTVVSLCLPELMLSTPDRPGWDDMQWPDGFGTYVCSFRTAHAMQKLRK